MLTPLGPPTGHDDTVIAAAISQQRIGRYRTATGNNHQAALALYDWNSRLAAQAQRLLGHVEVVARNAMNAQLVADIGPRWWDPADPTSPLTDKSADRAKGYIRAVQRRGRQPDAGRFVGESSLGFWVHLLDTNYETLWRTSLYKGFPHARLLRRHVRRPLDSLRELRNRIAHLEPLWTRNIHDDLDDATRILNWANPTVATWTAPLTDDIRTTLAQRP